MKCGHCGHKNPGLSRFCEKCGTQLRGKKKLPKKAFLIFCCTVLGICLLAGISFALLQAGISGNIVYREHDIILLYDDISDITQIIVDGEPAESLLNGRVQTQESSFDGSSMALIMNDRALYSVTTDKVIKVADDVVQAVISGNGASVGYADERGAVYRYNVKKKESTRMVSPGVINPMVTVSPDGKTFGISDKDEGYGWVYRIGREPGAMIDGRIIAVSDGGKHVYTIERDSSFNHVDRKGNKEKITSDPDYIIFNRSNTKLLFGYDNKLFYIPDQDEKYRIMNSDGFYVLSPHDIVSKQNPDIGYVQYSPYADFTGELYCTYEGDTYTYSIVYLNENCGVSTLASDLSLSDFAKMPKITEKKDTLYYIKGEALYADSLDLSEETEIVTESLKVSNEVLSFDLTADGKYVYYLNEYDELRCRIGGKTDRLLTDDVVSIHMTNGGTLLFRTEEEGMLYSCSSGKRIRRVSDDAYAVYTYSGTTLYYEAYDNGEVDIFASTNGKKFKKILSDTNAK